MPAPVTVHGRPEAVDGTAVMYCPRRTVLDKLLVDAARAAGAEVREATLVREVVRDGDRVVGVRAVEPTARARSKRARRSWSVPMGLNSGVADAVQARPWRARIRR